MAHVYNHILIRHLKWRTPQKIFLENKPKTLHFHVFGYGAYVLIPTEIHANKLAPYSKLIIFIGYEDNGYHFIHHIQENTIFCSKYAIFDEELFLKCMNSHAKEHKLYDELLDKTSLETESLMSNSSKKDVLAPVSIPHTSISPIQNNSSIHSPSPFLSYKSISPSPTLEPKKFTVEIEETNDVDSDVEMQPPGPQQPLQPSLQTPQEDPELRRFKHQTQISLRKGNIYGEWEHPTNILQNPL